MRGPVPLVDTTLKITRKNACLLGQIFATTKLIYKHDVATEAIQIKDFELGNDNRGFVIGLEFVDSAAVKRH